MWIHLGVDQLMWNWIPQRLPMELVPYLRFGVIQSWFIRRMVWRNSRHRAVTGGFSEFFLFFWDCWLVSTSAEGDAMRPRDFDAVVFVRRKRPR